MTTSHTRSKTTWYFRPPDFERAKIRLFCFPYAGGGTWIFRDWIRDLAPDVAVCAVKLPGRGDRYGDRPVSDLRELARAVVDGIASELGTSYAMFGHSMGALLAFECLRFLQAGSAPDPQHLIVSAARAPCRTKVSKPIYQLPDAEFVAEVQRRYSSPFLENAGPDVIELLLPPLRADMTAFETYVYSPAPRLSCPVTSFAGRGDSIARGDIEAWSEHTTGPQTIHEFDGGHFFIHDSEAEVRAQIRRILFRRPDQA